MHSVPGIAPQWRLLIRKITMSLALVNSRALLGLDSPSVTVEVHLANGLPSFTLVGLADTEVKEARERVRCAIHNSGFDFPNNKRITVNLAPAPIGCCGWPAPSPIWRTRPGWTPPMWQRPCNTAGCCRRLEPRVWFTLNLRDKRTRMTWG